MKNFWEDYKETIKEIIVGFSGLLLIVFAYKLFVLAINWIINL